jgi:hypothetical protein
MALEELVQRVGEQLNRRDFLGKLGKVGFVFLGATYAVLGLPQPALALHCVKCCCLCRSPSTNCCGSGTPYCVWSWTCCGYQNRKWRCSEFYCSQGDCNSDCSGVNCSKVVDLGSCSNPGSGVCNVC